MRTERNTSDLTQQCNKVKELIARGEETPNIHIITTVLSSPKYRGEMRRICLNACEDPNELDHLGRCALSLAALDGDLDSVQILLEKGADVNLKPDIDKATKFCSAVSSDPPLIAAVNGKHVDVVLKLLESGADIHCKDESGDTALAIAIKNGSDWRYNFDYIEKNGFDLMINDIDLDMIEVLVQHGADINQRITYKGGDYWDTPLTYASSLSNVALVSLALNNGADVNIQTVDDHVHDLSYHEGQTALMTALSGYTIDNPEKNETISLLLEHGANASIVESVYDYDDNGDVEDRDARKSCTALSRHMSELFWKFPTFSESPHNLPLIASLIYECCYNRTSSMEEHPKYFVIGRVMPKIPMHLCSPLFAALYYANIELAVHLKNNLLLTPYDLIHLPKNPEVKKCITITSELWHEESLKKFLDEMSETVPSLFELSFVSVSAAVGFQFGRDKRVQQLPLPDHMKRSLNFCPDK